MNRSYKDSASNTSQVHRNEISKSRNRLSVTQKIQEKKKSEKKDAQRYQTVINKSILKTNPSSSKNQFRNPQSEINEI